MRHAQSFIINVDHHNNDVNFCRVETKESRDDK